MCRNCVNQNFTDQDFDCNFRSNLCCVWLYGRYDLIRQVYVVHCWLYAMAWRVSSLCFLVVSGHGIDCVAYMYMDPCLQQGQISSTCTLSQTLDNAFCHSFQIVLSVWPAQITWSVQGWLPSSRTFLCCAPCWTTLVNLLLRIGLPASHIPQTAPYQSSIHRCQTLLWIRYV